MDFLFWNLVIFFCTDFIYIPSIFIDQFLFSCHFLDHRSNFPPVSHSTAAQLGKESHIIIWCDAPPSEVNVVSLYQRNVPASKEQFKVWTWKIWAVQPQPLFSVTAPLYCLHAPHPCFPPTEGHSSSDSSVDERLWLSRKSVGKLRKGQPCKCLLTPPDISEEES